MKNIENPLHCKLQQSAMPTRTTRQNERTFILSRNNTTQFSRCFFNSTTKLGNFLPDNIVLVDKLGLWFYRDGCVWEHFIICFWLNHVIKLVLCFINECVFSLSMSTHPWNKINGSYTYYFERDSSIILTLNCITWWWWFLFFIILNGTN